MQLRAPLSVLFAVGYGSLTVASCRFGFEDADELADGLGGASNTGGTLSTGDGDGDGDLNVDPHFGGMGGAPMKEVMIIESLPDGFTPGLPDPNAVDPPPGRGGYMRVGPLSELEVFEQEECANILRGITRDFDEIHDDFGLERPEGTGYVETMLSPDRKPVKTAETASEITAFGDWYTDVEGVNRSYVVDIWLEPVQDAFVFDSALYFPVDGEGTDTTYNSHDEMPHNFHFTTELHTSFEYKGGEFFTFRGDDDVWVFVNNQLAVDLGGVHGPLAGSIDLDASAEAFGLVKGQTYNLDLFHAERRQHGSNFRIETTLNFTGCGEILPVDVVK
jgi:fibro-slime domain-containing protein